MIPIKLHGIGTPITLRSYYDDDVVIMPLLIGPGNIVSVSSIDPKNPMPDRHYSGDIRIIEWFNNTGLSSHLILIGGGKYYVKENIEEIEELINEAYKLMRGEK